MKKNNYILLIFFLLFTFVIKDYAIPLMFYIIDISNESIYFSLLNALIQFGFLSLMALVYCFIQYKKGKKYLLTSNISDAEMTFARVCGFNKQSAISYVLTVVISVFCFFSFQLFKNAYLFLKYSFSSDISLVSKVSSIDINILIMLILVHVVWAGIGEELIYRRIIFGEILKKNKVLAYIISVVLFALAHNSTEQIIQATFLAIILCIVYHITNSISLCLILHIIYNSLGMLVTYAVLPPYALSSHDINHLAKQDLWIEAIKLSIIAIILLIIVLNILSGLNNSYCKNSDSYDKCFSK